MKMLLSHLLEYAVCLTHDKTNQINLYAPFYAFCHEVGNYMFISDGDNMALCFYGFCNLEDAEKIMSLPYDQACVEYYMVLARKQVRGPVVVPDLVCGKVTPYGKTFALSRWRDMGVQKILFHKTKLSKFFLMEV
jgi:hypothetical protein